MREEGEFREGVKVVEHESVLVREFHQVEGVAFVFGDQRTRDGEGILATEL